MAATNDRKRPGAPGDGAAVGYTKGRCTMTPTTGKAPAGVAEAFQNSSDTLTGAASTPHYTHMDGKGKASELLTALGLGRAGLIEVKCINPAYTHPGDS